MAKALISLRLPQHDLAALDQLAGTNGVNRSSLLEALVKSFLQEDFFLQRAIIRAAIAIGQGKDNS